MTWSLPPPPSGVYKSSNSCLDHTTGDWLAGLYTKLKSDNRQKKGSGQQHSDQKYPARNIWYTWTM